MGIIYFLIEIIPHFEGRIEFTFYASKTPMYFTPYNTEDNVLTQNKYTQHVKF